MSQGFSFYTGGGSASAAGIPAASMPLDLGAIGRQQWQQDASMRSQQQFPQQLQAAIHGTNSPSFDLHVMLRQQQQQASLMVSQLQLLQQLQRTQWIRALRLTTDIATLRQIRLSQLDGYHQTYDDRNDARRPRPAPGALGWTATAATTTLSAQSTLLPTLAHTCVARSPDEDAALMRRTLLVANFPRCWSDLALAHSFGTIVGRLMVARCGIVRGENGCSMGHAIVEFLDEDAADLAHRACDAGDLILVDKRGHPCVVEAQRAIRRVMMTRMSTESAVCAEDLMWTSAPSVELRMIL